MTPFTTHSYIDRRLLKAASFYTARKIHVPQSVEEHLARKKEILDEVKFICGFDDGLSFSTKTPCVRNKKHYHGITISDVEIETLPGLHLTGNLYMPGSIRSKLPAVLCPHGHWKNGRTHHDARGGVSMRCFQLARMGFIVFSYDMVGYNDNNFLPHAFSPELKKKCDLYGISIFSLQCANSLRAVNFILDLEEVDGKSLACTGASGGGTQTWFLALLDERIKYIVPVCMLSSHFQGGCQCEEAALLRRNSLSNFDVVASLAPRHIFLPAVTGDWTNMNPFYEIPRLKEIYALYHAEENVESIYFEDGHNYNKRTRESVYAYLLKHMKNIVPSVPVEEDSAIPPPPAELLLHTGKVPPPPSPEKIASSIELLKKNIEEKVFDKNIPITELKKRNFDKLKKIIPCDADCKDIAEELTSYTFDLPGMKLSCRHLCRRDEGDWVMALFVIPEKITSSRSFLIPAPGKVEDFFDNNTPCKLLKTLTENGMGGVIIELTATGSREKMLSFAARNFDDPLDLAFNDTIYSMRVQDILTAKRRLEERDKIAPLLIAPSPTVPEALAASVLAGNMPGIFDMKNTDDSLWNEFCHYQPHIMRIGGIKGLMMLADSRENIFVSPPEKYTENFIEKAYITQEGFPETLEAYFRQNHIF